METTISKSMAEALATSSSSISSSNKSREMENLSLEISKYPRDLLQRLITTNNQSKKRLDDLHIGGHVDEDDDGLNLGLGLSLGGKFGVDKSHKGLIRSSSIAGTMPLIREGDTLTLVRTASLPVESEEEWRKRKEIQTLRRMEAKRRRSEKQRILKETGGVVVNSCGEEKGNEGLNFRGRLKREQQCLGMSNNNVEVKGRRTTFGSLQGFLMAQAQALARAQGSGESQGGNSSGASDLESKIHQGSSSGGEERSPTSTQSQQDRGSQDSGAKGESIQGASGLEEETNSGVDSKRREEGGMEEMPCVFTIGRGPNGVRKVEGILYRYGKAEGVRIMCVCHGNFFCPAEFVKHAGGTDVEHPLRHIVVSPSASPFS